MASSSDRPSRGHVGRRSAARATKYVFFIDAAVTERFSQTGSLRTYLEEEADLAAPRPAGNRATRSSLALAPRASWRQCARCPSSASPRFGCCCAPLAPTRTSSTCC
eukprot:6179056-Pleurochrysis_carterae.AAC.3